MRPLHLSNRHPPTTSTATHPPTGARLRGTQAGADHRAGVDRAIGRGPVPRVRRRHPRGRNHALGLASTRRGGRRPAGPARRRSPVGELWIDSLEEGFGGRTLDDHPWKIEVMNKLSLALALGDPDWPWPPPRPPRRGGTQTSQISVIILTLSAANMSAAGIQQHAVQADRRPHRSLNSQIDFTFDGVSRTSGTLGSSGLRGRQGRGHGRRRHGAVRLRVPDLGQQLNNGNRASCRRRSTVRARGSSTRRRPAASRSLGTGTEPSPTRSGDGGVAGGLAALAGGRRRGRPALSVGRSPARRSARWTGQLRRLDDPARPAADPRRDQPRPSSSCRRPARRRRELPARRRPQLQPRSRASLAALRPVGRATISPIPIPEPTTVLAWAGHGRGAVVLGPPDPQGPASPGFATGAKVSAGRRRLRITTTLADGPRLDPGAVRLRRPGCPSSLLRPDCSA